LRSKNEKYIKKSILLR
jgi:hypothetical protein